MLRGNLFWRTVIEQDSVVFTGTEQMQSVAIILLHLWDLPVARPCQRNHANQAYYKPGIM